jgi:hypothetical protein
MSLKKTDSRGNRTQNSSLQFSSLFIFTLSSTLSGQLQSRHEYKALISNKKTQGQNK